MAPVANEVPPGEAPATPDTEPRSEESEPEGLENSDDPEELISRPLLKQHQRSIASRALLHMCIHMYAQVELPEYELQVYKLQVYKLQVYKLQVYKLPEYNLTKDGVNEEPVTEEIGEPASGEVPDGPAEDKTRAATPTETKCAEDEVPAAATPDEYEGPAEAGVRTETPGPAEDTEAPLGEVLAGVKVPTTTKDHTEGDKVKAPVATTTTEVPAAA